MPVSTGSTHYIYMAKKIAGCEAAVEEHFATVLEECSKEDEEIN
jgi:hypothetical protein